MKIRFDQTEYTSTLQIGSNPKFNFDQIITKEIKFDDMENRYLEIILLYLPSSYDTYNNGSLEKILKNAKYILHLK